MSSTNATMSPATLQAVAKLLPVDRAIMIRGPHGIGKSSITHQLAEHFGLKVIDFRLGQRTPGDIIGLPDLSDGETKFCPPDELMQACKEPCLVFFDELNRGTEEVIQAVFQAALDRRIGKRMVFHPETRVIAAINLDPTRYTVTRIDPALLDRFFVCDLTANVEDWLSWARANGVSGLIRDFIAAHPSALFPSEKAEHDSVQPTPRSWAFVDQTLRAAGKLGTKSDDYNDPLFYSICVGYLGVEVANAFVGFAKSIERITGRDVLERMTLDPVRREEKFYMVNDKDGVPHKRVVDKKYWVGKVDAAVRDLPVEQVAALIEDVGELLNKMENVPGPELWGKNVGAFMYMLPTELKVALWAAIARRGTDKLDMIKWIHPFIAEELVTGGFCVPVGEVGVGIPPSIPEALKAKAA